MPSSEESSPLAFLASRTDQLHGAARMCTLQNACIVAAAATALLLLGAIPSAHALAASSAGGLSAGAWLFMIATIILGASSGIGSMGVTVSVEKEWSKVVCGDDASRLSSLNSRMRAIDMVALMLAPLACGLLMTYAGLAAAMWAVLGLTAAVRSQMQS